MIWNSVHEFVAMGGYGPYVWGACGVCFAALAVETWLVRRRLCRARAALGEDA